MTFEDALAALIPHEKLRALLNEAGIGNTPTLSGSGPADPAILEAVARAADEVVLLWETSPLADVLPALPELADQEIEWEQLRPSLFYNLRREGIDTWGDLIRLSAADLRSREGFGPKSLHILATTSLWQVIDLAHTLRRANAARALIPDLLAGPASPRRDRTYAVLTRYVREPRLVTVLAEMLNPPPSPAHLPGPPLGQATAQAIEAATGMIMYTLADIRLGDALPGLHALNGKTIDLSSLGTQERRVLSITALADFGQLARFKPRELLTRPPLSAESVHVIIAQALREVISGAAAAFPEALGTGTPPLQPAQLMCALDKLAWWAAEHRDATQIGDLLKLSDGLAPVPTDLQQTWDAAAKSTLTDLTAPPLAADMASVLGDLLGGFDDRRRTILTERVFTATPATLADLAGRLSLSSERIRALESDSINRLRHASAADRQAPLRWRAAELRRRFPAGPPSSREAEVALGELNGDVPADMRDFADQLLLWLAGFPRIPCSLT